MDIARLRKKLQQEKEESERRKRAAEAQAKEEREQASAEPVEPAAESPEESAVEASDVPAGPVGETPAIVEEAEPVEESPVESPGEISDVPADYVEEAAGAVASQAEPHPHAEEAILADEATESRADESAPASGPESPIPGEVGPPDRDVGDGDSPGQQVMDEDLPGDMGTVELLMFALGKELYAFRIFDLQEVLAGRDVTHVPNCAGYILGITSLRGKIIPVMDLRARLKLNIGNGVVSKNIIILKGSQKGVIGAAVDKMIDVMEVAEADVMPPPSHLEESVSRFIEGVVSSEEGFVSIINPEELLNFMRGGNES